MKSSRASSIYGPTHETSSWTSQGLWKPTDNAFIESLKGKFRAECLNAHWFLSLEDAIRKIESWRRHYKSDHRAMGNHCKRCRAALVEDFG